MMNIREKQREISKKATALQLQVSNPESSIWVSASAGTGKTHVLTQRILRLLLNDSNLKISEILAITFTKAASVEMQNRLIEELSKWTKMSEEKLTKKIGFLLQRYPTKKELKVARILLTKVLDDPIGLNISTIHSFCETLLRKFPMEAGVPSSFSLIEERDEKRLLKKSWFKAIKELSNQNPDLFYEVFSLMGEFSLEEAINDILNNKNRFYSMLERFDSLESFIMNMKSEFAISDKKEKDLRSSVLKFTPDDRSLLKEIMQLSYLDKGVGSQKNAIILDNILAANFVSTKNINDYLSIFLTQKYEPKKRVFAAYIKKNASFDIDAFCIKEIDRVLNILEDITNIQSFKISKSIALLANRMFEIYKQEKLDLAMLDFTDLIEYSQSLVNKTEVQDWVRYKLDSKIKHCLLDEAQDTDYQQWDILKAIIEEFYYGEGQHESSRTAFAVGDMKQSIYRFRGANPEVFDNIRKDLNEKSSHVNHDFKVIDMHTSFRSTKAVLNFVDDVFQDSRRKVALDGIDKELEHKVYNIGDAGRVEISPILTKSDLEDQILKDDFYEIKKTKQKDNKKETLRRLNYRNVANKIVYLFNHEDFSPQDIIILVRSRTGISELTDELTKANIPHTGSDQINLTNSFIVEDLLNIAKFICFKDDLSLLSVMKSPIFNLDDRELFTEFSKYKKEKKYKTFFSFLKTEKKFENIVGELNIILSLSGKTRLVDLYIYIINSLKLTEKYMALTAGIVEAQQNQVEETIQEFLNQIEGFSDLSVLSFLNWFSKENIIVKKNTANIKNAVRIMTCHGSKGLEGKAIFIPDCGVDSVKESMSKEKLIFKKDDKFQDDYFIYVSGSRELKKTKLEKDILFSQEELFYNDDMRLLYVALTRARSNIFISGVQNSSKELSENTWYSILYSVMKSNIDSNKEGYSELADGTLVFKTPQLLDGDIKPEDIDLEDNFLDCNIPNWVNEKAELENSIQQERSSYNLTSKEYIEKLQNGISKDYVYGNIVHKLLEELPKVEKLRRVDYIYNYLKNKKEISNKESLQKNILSILESFEDLFGSNSLSEVPVQYQTSTKIHSGTIDRLVIKEDKVLIIDYKTGAKSADKLDRYKKQLESYRNIISKVYPDKKIETAILWVSKEELEII